MKPNELIKGGRWRLILDDGLVDAGLYMRDNAYLKLAEQPSIFRARSFRSNLAPATLISART